MGVLGVDGSVFEAFMTGRSKGSQGENASLLLPCSIVRKSSSVGRASER